MPYQVPDRVHIMPVGFEEDRIFKTADELKADKVVLVVNKGDSKKEREHRRIAIEQLEKLGYDPTIVESDIFDLYASLGDIAKIIEEYSEHDVHVNVSTGSKVTAIAGMIAAMMTGANAYYVKARDYLSDDVPRGIDTVFQLPHYPIQSPDIQHLEVLKHLEENEMLDVTKSDLIDFSEKKNLQFIADRDVSRKAKYRLLDSHIVEPLLNQGYIQITEKGRNRLVDISEDGRDLVRAFGFLIQEGYKGDNEQKFPASS